MKKGMFAIIVLSFIFASGFFSAIGIADNIPIQIQTLDGSGNVITGTYAFQINISNTIDCSSVLYSNTTTMTTDSRGIVSYALENVNLAFDEQYWFCYYRNGVLKETIKAARVPYAFIAKNVSAQGVMADSNLNLGNYNLTANYLFGDGSQLTGISSSGSGVPVGTISAFNLSSCPVGWILADGTSGTPDLRGIFIRGSGVNGILNYANSTYGGINATYGTYGNDSLQGHWHQMYRTGGTGASNSISQVANALSPVNVDFSAITIAKEAITDGVDGTPRTGKETSPAYYATIYCIKTAEDTPVSNSIWTISGNNIAQNNVSKNVLLSNNITADYFIGDGSQLTGISGNANISDYYRTYDTGWISRSDWTNVQLGSNTTKNANSNITHGLDAPLSDLSVRVLVSSDGTDAHSFIADMGPDYAGAGSNNFGITIYQTDNNNILVQTGTQGLTYNDNVGNVGLIDTEDWYYKVIVNHVIALNSTPLFGGTPANAIMAFNQASCPTGWILADGTSGTPDLRGIFIRGSGINGILNYANSTYGGINATYGTYGNDSLQGHYHTFNYLGNTWTPAGAGTILASNAGSQTDKVTNAITDGTNGAPRTGKETSPAYYATIYCIKTAEDTPVSNSIWTISGNNIAQNNVSKNVNIASNLTVGGSLTVSGNPSFSAFISGTADYSSGTTNFFKVPFNNTDWDTTNSFDETLNRFTPGINGTYMLTATVLQGVTAPANTISVAVYKNGVVYKNVQQIFAGSTGFQIANSITALVQANSTDYFEIYARNANQNSVIIGLSGNQTTYFQGSKIA